MLEYQLKQQLVNQQQSTDRVLLETQKIFKQQQQKQKKKKRENVCDSKNRNVKIVYAKSVHFYYLLYFYFSYKSSQRQIQGVDGIMVTV